MGGVVLRRPVRRRLYLHGVAAQDLHRLRRLSRVCRIPAGDPAGCGCPIVLRDASAGCQILQPDSIGDLQRRRGHHRDHRTAARSGPGSGALGGAAGHLRFELHLI